MQPWAEPRLRTRDIYMTSAHAQFCHVLRRLTTFGDFPTPLTYQVSLGRAGVSPLSHMYSEVLSLYIVVD